MKFFAPFRLILLILWASAIPLDAQFISPGRTLNGADRTITWRPWQQNPTDEFRFRTGDRYLGRAVWEHYLEFEQRRTSSKAIKLSMVRLGNEDVGEEVVLRPGSRYAILKVTNGTMTARKGVWSWMDFLLGRVVFKCCDTSLAAMPSGCDSSKKLEPLL